MNYYERHLGDYAKDTGHLSMLEHGAYCLLLDRYYATEHGIPEDQAHRIARAKSRDERAAVDVVLREFFVLEGGVWVNGRTEEEIVKTRARIEAAKKNGRGGGRPKKNPDLTQEKPSGLGLGSETETQTKAHHTPDTIHQTPIKEDVDDARARLNLLDEQLREAAGGALDPTSVSLMVLDRPLAWANDGCDLERDVLPAIRAACARASPKSIRSWKYFDHAVADAKARRLAPMPQGRSNERTHTQSRDESSRQNHLEGLARAVAAARG